MKLPIQVTFRNMPSSPEVEDCVQKEAAKLDRFFPRITSCRVVVEIPHRHHRNRQCHHLSVEIGVPGKQLVVNREPNLHDALKQGGVPRETKQCEVHNGHDDIFFAIRDAFRELKGQLKDYAQKLRGEVKQHEHIPRRRKKKPAAGETGEAEQGPQ